MRTIFIKAAGLALTLTATSAVGISARQLTPAEALDAATRWSGVKRVGAVAQVAAAPVYTATEGRLNTVYIFNRADNGGYMIVAADDVATPLLGYADDGAIDPTDMPPSLKWWIDNYSRQIAAATTSTPSDSRMMVSARTDRAAIAPMLTTLWNQDAPYNNLCPTQNGTRCVTGCVATALAQMMKYHNWPVKGTGTASYSWNNTTLSFNYSDTTFDWANMLDSYTSGSTAAQDKAVATLMYAAGVASQMNYSPGGSGTNSYYAARGLVNYLNYSKELRVLSREYFGINEWVDIVYNELQSGRPVVYAGQSSEGGHCFVCDGYSTDDYFHFNWGWGGMSNGYYRLTALDPTSQGIGGSGAGYNDGQEIMVDCKPAAAGETAGVVIASPGNFSSQNTTYRRGENIMFTVSGADSNYFFNLSVSTITPTFGLKLTSADGTETYIEGLSTATLEMLQGVSGYYVAVGSLPTSGTYTVTPAAKCNGRWWDIQVRVGKTNSLKLSINNGTYTFTPIAVNASLTATNLTISTPLYSGLDCQISADVTNTGNGEFFGQVMPVLCTLSGTSASIVAQGTSQTIDVPVGETVAISAIINFGKVTPGSYYFGLVDTDAWAIVGSLKAVTVEAAPSGTLSLTATTPKVVTGLVSPATATSRVKVKSESSSFKYTLGCTSGGMSGIVGGYIFDENYQSVESFGQQFVTILAGEKKDVTLSGQLSNLDENRTYILAPWNLSGTGEGQIGYNFLYFTVDKTSTGIDDTGVTMAYTLTCNGTTATIGAPAPITRVEVFTLAGVLAADYPGVMTTSMEVDTATAGGGVFFVKVTTTDGSHTFKMAR